MSAAKSAPIVRPAPFAPAADPAVSRRPTVRKAAAEEDISFDDAGGIDLGEGMEDAEAALEAMQNFRLAEAALQRNDTANAEQLAQKAVDGDPTQADYITLLAWVKALGNDPTKVKEAVATMSKVLIEDPSNERALLYRGKLLVRTNRLHDALNDFDELLATNPHHREAANELRALKQKMGAP
jgi:Flp pilus assembly protein TadD